MPETLLIPRRFNGPPDSGHGGYSAGLLGTLHKGPAEVALRAPPPLDVPLAVERREDGSIAVLHEGSLIMDSKPVALDLEPPRALSLDEAEAGPTRFQWADYHPFPTCFACGPDREPGDGLRLFAGPVEAGDDLHGVPWTPAAEFADADGAVDPLFVWAALDCPTGAAGANDPGLRRPVVLGSFTVDVREPVAASQPHAIGAWRTEVDGRKRRVGVALWDATGSLRALGQALWIELRE